MKLNTLDYHITLKSDKKTARSPALVLPNGVFTCIHVVNYTTKSYVNANTSSHRSNCDFFVNWKDFSMLRKQQAKII